jgi:hypothetical protein
MTTTFTREQLIDWIESTIQDAREDARFSIAWFKPTEKSPLAIIAGWQELDEPEGEDSFCRSKAYPKYTMAIKIAENHGPYAYTDYEIMNMPWDRKTGDVEDTEVFLEWDDPVDYMADHFRGEWIRLMRTIGEDPEE